MGRSPCCSKIGMNRGPWSIHEDSLLIHYIQTHGHGHWRSLPSKAGLLRCGKSCRLRWVNYLRPGVKRGNFTSHENEAIIRLHSLHGNRWSLIAAEFPGRTDNEIKNHWNTHLRKKPLGLLQNHHLSQQTTATNKSLNRNLTKDNMNKKDGPSGQIKESSKMVINYESATQTTSSGTSYSSVVTDAVDAVGEVNMNINVKVVSDTFFYELDDFIDIDQRMRSCDYIISEAAAHIGTEQHLERD